MATCHETGCSRPASCCVEIEADDETQPGLRGFTVPACKDHVLSIGREVRRICEGAEISVRVVPIEKGKYPPAVNEDD